MVQINKAKHWLDLKKLILILATLCVFTSLLNALFSSYQVQKQVMVKDTLEANRAYATKLADVTDLFLQSVLMQLKASSETIATQLDNPEVVNKELSQMLTRTHSFDSIVLVNAKGEIIGAQPSSLGVIGATLKNEVETLPLREKAPFIVGPFVSPAGNLMVSPTHPMFDQEGIFVGFIAAGIYLKGDNILGRLLANHHHQDKTYIYVTGPNGKLIYHHDDHRIGQDVTKNEVVESLLSKTSGSAQIVNTQGVAMLAGYASVATSGWGVVAQRPLEVTMSQLSNTMRHVLKTTIPFTVFLLICVLGLGTLIAKPLWRLAKLSEQVEDGRNIDFPHVSTWYYEAAWLYQAMHSSVKNLGAQIQRFDDERKQDQLTHLFNRRGMEKWLENAYEQQTPFSIIALDIDHFKHVNDTYGHDVGDVVIRKLAELMRTNAREQDHLCRSGGEEFLMFLPHVDIDKADRIAERLRACTAETEFGEAGHITISLGISHWPLCSEDLHHALKLADRSLYQAKANGRNRVEHAVIANHNVA
ncbi:GGDEF domain-containing protein [Pseudoalteromonas sp. CO348]|uniref:sensor domain-containing diguanylate cyclase n=1 Tax=Pseudoalteromonas TaxID=53246 RepID=UPI001023C49D|nr:sensor domain-containing diguanylate cyclase [Pseudoalteromonas sp. CO348]MCG9768265.1 sensor domain-containing diguanylate cyclase [Pseudoalteromonas piscicida]RZF99789.1 GGDEF domain-containing protein [Pseudoalteromonas sp. CO348]